MLKNDEIKIPKHVAIILDGNGRWAQARGLKRNEGHLAGYNNLLKISEYIFSKGTRYLSVFAFSTENFKRPPEEVNYLMQLFINGFKKDTGFFAKKNIKVVFSGKTDNLSVDVVNAIYTLEENTRNNTQGTLNICLNYGGRQEIVEATKKICLDVINKKIDINDIDESIYRSYLFHDLPDVDFLIRTSGEIRVSNFMLWQISYAEMYFPKCYFPDFNKKEYDLALVEYSKRSRRIGGLNSNEN